MIEFISKPRGRSPRVRRNQMIPLEAAAYFGSISARAEEPLTSKVLELLYLSKSCVH